MIPLKYIRSSVKVIKDSNLDLRSTLFNENPYGWELERI